MCGLAGILKEAGDPGQLEKLGLDMAAAIRHRGPDDAGAWTDAAGTICLAHRRLSILDLSAAGHQPMLSEGGRLVLAFNGEIYNCLELRAELEAAGAAPQWRGHSDTEVLLAGFLHWGVEATLERSVGMFSLALWDTQERTLYLARDRFGEKPLYYGWSRGAFVFGSELKALRAWPGFEGRISRSALALYLRFLYVPAPHSIYEGVYKLEPGCLLRIAGRAPSLPPTEPLRPPATFGTCTIRRWWSLADLVEAGTAAPLDDEAQAIESLEECLTTAVRGQCLADVPLGAFLSGGVDSSTIVALMQKQATRPVRTFTVGFEEAGFDESLHARAIARHLGTEHSELVVTAAEARQAIPWLPTMYDEPFADSSQIPTHLVCRFARQHVTVALSGDAGDELFGGYNRYSWAPAIWNRVGWMPHPLRHALTSVMGTIPTGAWDRLGPLVARGRHGHQRVGDKAHKLARRLAGVRNIDDFYLSLVSEWPLPGELVKGVREPHNVLSDPLPGVGAEHEILRMMYRDGISYLPDDILCKVDRAAMAVSLETRIPFLDHRVAELAWRLPLSMKVRGRQGKWILRQVLYKHVPRELIERPKAGFAIPVGQWLRGPLRDWAEDLLADRRLESEGLVDLDPARALWKQHLGGHHDWTARLWGVLMLQSWSREQY